jgi:heptosyltransferase-2
MSKTVFFMMNQLGDLMFALPVIKACRQQTNSQIFCVVKSQLAPLLISAGLIDGTIDKGQCFLKLVKEIKSHNFNNALLFSESPSSILAAFLSGIKNKIGFKSASLNFLLNKKVKKTGVPSIINNCRLGFDSGLGDIPKDYLGILKIPAENFQNISNWFADKKIDPSKTFAISTGSSKKRKDKQVPNKIWADIINLLQQKNITVVLSGAPYEKSDLKNLAALCPHPPEIFTAQSGILDSAAFLQTCKMFLGIDSGAMHLAAALGTKCAGIFINTDPAQIGPRPLQKHIIINCPDKFAINPQNIVSVLLP